MSILFDYDVETGIRTTFDYDPIRDQAFLTYEQDVTGFLDRMNELRNNPEISAKGMKENWWHYASIPEVVEMQLIKKGLSIYDKNHTAAILKEINQNYPHLKATEKHHQ